MSHVATAHALQKARYPRTLEICLGAGILLHVLVFLMYPPVDIAPFRLPGPPPEPTRMIDFRIAEAPKLPVLPTDLSPPDLAELNAELVQVADIEPVVPTQATVDVPIPAPGAGSAGSNPTHVVDEREPTLLRSVRPDYPALAREAGAEGTVVVEVLVDPSGRVTDARIVESDTVESLKRAALEAARRFLFAPARQQRAAVSAWVTIPFTFRLR
jgi:protein TonB